MHLKVLAKIYKVWYKIYRKSNEERKEVFNYEKLQKKCSKKQEWYHFNRSRDNYNRPFDIGRNFYFNVKSVIIGILKKAGDAKELTGIGQEKETIAIAYNSALAKKIGNGDSTAVTAGDLNTELTNQGATADGSNPIIVTFTNSKRQYTINSSETIEYAGIQNEEEPVTPTEIKLGDAYEDNWIGKQITYSANGVSDWIIIGQDSNKNVLITTKNPIGGQSIERTLSGWLNYEDTLNGLCDDYAGTIVGNGTTARSITMDDINYAAGYTETINLVTIGDGYAEYHAYPNEDGTGWISYYAGDDYKTYGPLIEMYSYEFDGAAADYLSANYETYLVATKGVFTDIYSDDFLTYVGATVSGLSFNSLDFAYCPKNSDPWEADSTEECSIRPVVEISGDILYKDVENLIGEYTTYE